MVEAWVGVILFNCENKSFSPRNHLIRMNETFYGYKNFEGEKFVQEFRQIVNCKRVYNFFVDKKIAEVLVK